MRGWLMMAAAGLLAACGGDQPAGDAVAGGGEVLEGTANDAMLPLATVTSQPPLAPPEPAETTRAGASPAAAAAPEPVETASPEQATTDTATD
ncbi:hypothetical protein V5740_08650 [Croceibacterium sp. TMG7-5b_MA50]|uniref:hypothetical protein n=1 Tax=Croceibacterium sp. TMG7-5b_MA50 TaxID=3121290 RepID=UPI0032219AD2